MTGMSSIATVRPVNQVLIKVCPDRLSVGIPFRTTYIQLIVGRQSILVRDA